MAGLLILFYPRELSLEGAEPKPGR
jgi:hypothetical protein